MKNAIFVFLVAGVLSCNKMTPVAVIPYSEASYKVTVSMNWAAPKFGVPAGAHVTPLIGIVHSKDTFLWMPGRLATSGLEDVAEIGNNTKMNAELDEILLRKKALAKFSLPAPAVTGTTETNLMFNTNYPAVSFASMIAPSPDWFMGVHDVSLFMEKTWITDTTLTLFVYDAGTEDGNAFSYDNPASLPQRAVGLLTSSNAPALANGNTAIAAIGTIRFTKN